MSAYIEMRAGDPNILTRIINCVKYHELPHFTAHQLEALMNEGGETPINSISACLSENARYNRYFVRIARGVYALIKPLSHVG